MTICVAHHGKRIACFPDERDARTFMLLDGRKKLTLHMSKGAKKHRRKKGRR